MAKVRVSSHARGCKLIDKFSDFATKSPKSKSSSSTRDSLKHSTGGEQDSFAVFSFTMFQQLFKDQELRAKQQRALLKQREDAIYEKSKAELIFLENQKK
jgi:hypothetical protein